MYSHSVMLTYPSFNAPTASLTHHILSTVYGFYINMFVYLSETSPEDFKCIISLQYVWPLPKEWHWGLKVNINTNKTMMWRFLFSSTPSLLIYGVSSTALNPITAPFLTRTAHRLLNVDLFPIPLLLYSHLKKRKITVNLLIVPLV